MSARRGFVFCKSTYWQTLCLTRWFTLFLFTSENRGNKSKTVSPSHQIPRSRESIATDIKVFHEKLQAHLESCVTHNNFHIFWASFPAAFWLHHAMCDDVNSVWNIEFQVNSPWLHCWLVSKKFPSNFHILSHSQFPDKNFQVWVVNLSPVTLWSSYIWFILSRGTILKL